VTPCSPLFCSLSRPFLILSSSPSAFSIPHPSPALPFPPSIRLIPTGQDADAPFFTDTSSASSAGRANTASASISTCTPRRGRRMVRFSLASFLPYLPDARAVRPRCGLTSGVDDARVGGGRRDAAGMNMGSTSNRGGPYAVAEVESR
jgi:hypothetical protein